MLTRRSVLIAGSSLGVTATAGCLSGLFGSATLREVRVELHNSDGESHTFHVALETESGMLTWKSRTVGPDERETVIIEPDGKVDPIALHGTVSNFAGQVELIGLDSVDQDYCLHLEFFYEYPGRGEPEILYSSDIRC